MIHAFLKRLVVDYLNITPFVRWYAFLELTFAKEQSPKPWLLIMRPCHNFSLTFKKRKYKVLSNKRNIGIPSNEESTDPPVSIFHTRAYDGRIQVLASDYLRPTPTMELNLNIFKLLFSIRICSCENNLLDVHYSKIEMFWLNTKQFIKTKTFDKDNSKRVKWTNRLSK